jgi:hypothetical protein
MLPTPLVELEVGNSEASQFGMHQLKSFKADKKADIEADMLGMRQHQVEEEANQLQQARKQWVHHNIIWWHTFLRELPRHLLPHLHHYQYQHQRSLKASSRRKP